MKHTYNVLNTIFWTSLSVSLAMVVLFETNILPNGVCHTVAGSSEFVWATLMELLTLCTIPVALRLFRFDSVAKRLVSAEALCRFGSIRLLMLCVPMVVNTLLYYIYMNVAFGYMGIILFLSLFFVMPTAKRCEDEVRPNEDKNK